MPFNVDNFFAMYVLINYLRIGRFTRWVKLKLGTKSELELRRAGDDSWQPTLHRGVTVEVKQLENYQLYIFTPEV